MKKELEQRMKRVPVGDILLSVIGITALMSFAILMPNAVQALKIFGVGKKKLNRHKYYLNDAINKLYLRG